MFIWIPFLADRRTQRERTPLVYSMYGGSESYSVRRPTTTTTPSPPTPERRKRRRSGDVSPISELPEGERAATTTAGTLQPAAEEWVFPKYDVESETEWLEAFCRLTAPLIIIDTTTTTTTTIPAPAEPDNRVARREVNFLEDLGELEDSRQRSRSRTPQVGRDVERRRSTRAHTTPTTSTSRVTTTTSIESAATTTPTGRSRRRARTATTPRREEVEDDYPKESEVEESGDVFPSHVNLAGNVPEYVRESEDFRLISRWVSRLPQSRTSPITRERYGVQFNLPPSQEVTLGSASGTATSTLDLLDTSPMEAPGTGTRTCLSSRRGQEGQPTGATSG